MLEFNGTAIVIAISFVIFVILENFIFYKPMRKVLEERAAYMESNEKEADKNYNNAKSLVEEKDKKISDAKDKSAQLLNEISLKTQAKFDSSIKEAKINSNSKIEETKKNLEAEAIEAQNALRNEIGLYAASIVSKILKKEVAMVNVSDEIINKAMKGEL